MSTQQGATVYVINNTGGNAIIFFSHQYSDENTQIYESFAQVPSGGTTGGLAVTFWTGDWAWGTDYWFCGARVLTGPNAGATFVTEGSLGSPSKECMMETPDAGMTYYFPVSQNGFVMTLLSGPCSTSVSG